MFNDSGSFASPNAKLRKIPRRNSRHFEPGFKSQRLSLTRRNSLTQNFRVFRNSEITYGDAPCVTAAKFAGFPRTHSHYRIWSWWLSPCKVPRKRFMCRRSKETGQDFSWPGWSLRLFANHDPERFKAVATGKYPLSIPEADHWSEDDFLVIFFWCGHGAFPMFEFPLRPPSFPRPCGGRSGLRSG